MKSLFLKLKTLLVRRVKGFIFKPLCVKLVQISEKFMNVVISLDNPSLASLSMRPHVLRILQCSVKTKKPSYRSVKKTEVYVSKRNLGTTESGWTYCKMSTLFPNIDYRSCNGGCIQPMFWPGGWWLEIVEILLSAGKMTRNEEIILSQYYYVISDYAR